MSTRASKRPTASSITKELCEKWAQNPTVNPITGAKIDATAKTGIYQLFKSQCEKHGIVIRAPSASMAAPASPPRPSSPAPTASESKWVKKFVNSWLEDTNDTEANIIIRPIPPNVGKVLGLSARENARVEAARESMGMNCALRFEVAEDHGTVFAYLNEDDRSPIFDLKEALKIRHATPGGTDVDWVSFDHDDINNVEKMAKRFVSILKQLLEPVAAETNIRLEAVPADDLATDDNWYGKAVLRDLYGEYLVQKCGMPHKNIRIVTLYYNDDDGEYYYRPVVFRAPTAQAAAQASKKSKGRK